LIAAAAWLTRDRTDRRALVPPAAYTAGCAALIALWTWGVTPGTVSYLSFAPGKPQLVVETATNSGAGVPGAGVGSAASFITGMASYLQQVAGPQYGVIGVCWFDTDTNNNYNWRVDQTASAWQAWLALARTPYFGGHGS